MFNKWEFIGFSGANPFGLCYAISLKVTSVVPFYFSNIVMFGSSRLKITLGPQILHAFKLEKEDNSGRHVHVKNNPCNFFSFCF